MRRYTAAQTARVVDELTWRYGETRVSSWSREEYSARMCALAHELFPPRSGVDELIDLVRLVMVALVVAWAVWLTMLVLTPTPDPLPLLRIDPADGRVMVPHDLNGDGLIVGDVEQGS